MVKWVKVRLTPYVKISKNNFLSIAFELYSNILGLGDMLYQLKEFNHDLHC